ncbi:hypothetical protein ACT29H_02995 [Thermophagus sp. OGC60D27]|uniref:hypothetical protein n=1 Tax=Thermophagus sp. OGC60D27 TaxID=3458415 RepID=UPI00403766CE
MKRACQTIDWIMLVSFSWIDTVAAILSRLMIKFCETIILIIKNFPVNAKSQHRSLINGKNPLQNY